jgi:5-oxoprolinase (ATP-hydrolysing)
MAILRKQAEDDLISKGIASEFIQYENYASLRYEGSDTNISVLQPQDNDFVKAFIDQYRREFAFELTNRPVVVDTIRVRGTGNINKLEKKESLFDELAAIPGGVTEMTGNATHKAFLDGKWQDVPRHNLKELKAGTRLTVSC